MLIGRAITDTTSQVGEIADDRFHVLEGDLFGEHRRSGESFPLDEVVLGTPLEGVRFVNVMGGFLAPGTVRPPERVPMWLPKATNFPTGDGGRIQVPSVLTGPVVMEAELGVVVGRPLRKASPQEAHDAVFGWSVFNDLTANEYGAFASVGLWALGKSIDGFTSWGPWIRRDLTEERVMEGLAITGRVNGTQVQSGNTSLFCYTPSELLSHVSHRISLFPGDVVALGTPPQPPEVVVGDHVECEVEEIGVLNNYIIEETIEPPSLMPRHARVAGSLAT